VTAFHTGGFVGNTLIILGGEHNGRQAGPSRTAASNVVHNWNLPAEIGQGRKK